MNKTISHNMPRTEASLIRRYFAFAIDSLFLGIIGFILGLAFSDIFFFFGYSGWWIGYLVSLAYYSISTMPRMGGQSVGGRVLGIAVVSTDGTYLRSRSALIRSALLMLVFYITNILELIPYSHLELLIISGILTTSYVAAFLVFILFNMSRRGIHDIAAGSVVVNKKVFDKLTAKEKKELNKNLITSKKPLKISTILISLIIVGGIAVSIFNPLKNTFFGDLYNVTTAIENQTGLRPTSVMLRTYMGQNGKTSKAIVVTAFVDGYKFSSTEALRDMDAQIKKLIITNYPDIKEIDELEVIFTSGYSIGIWTYEENKSGTPTSLEPLKSKLK